MRQNHTFPRLEPFTIRPGFRVHQQLPKIFSKHFFNGRFHCQHLKLESSTEDLTERCWKSNLPLFFWRTTVEFQIFDGFSLNRELEFKSSVKNFTNKREKIRFTSISPSFISQKYNLLESKVHLCFSKHFFNGRLRFHLLFVQSSTEEMILVFPTAFFSKIYQGSYFTRQF